MNHQFIELEVQEGVKMDVYKAFPEGKGPFPGLLLFQEAFGVNHHIQNIAERLCKEGYAVYAPDLFHRTGKRLDIAYADFALAMPHFQAINYENLNLDIKACYHSFQEDISVKSDRIGCFGFCLGGRVAFYTNTILPIKASIAFYGGGINALAERAHLISAPQLFVWGGKDERITPEIRKEIIEATEKANKPYVSAIFSQANHAFNCDERPNNYHEASAKEAWALSIAFLSNHLK